MVTAVKKRKAGRPPSEIETTSFTTTFTTEVFDALERHTQKNRSAFLEDLAANALRQAGVLPRKADRK